MHIYILRNAGILLALALTIGSVAYLPLLYSVAGDASYALIFMAPILGVICNLCGMIFLTIFLRRIMLVVLAYVAMIMAYGCLVLPLSAILADRMDSSLVLLAIGIQNAVSFLLALGVITLDNILSGGGLSTKNKIILLAVLLGILALGLWHFSLISPPRKGEIGGFTDPRDGQEYRTVEIGKNTWMARNLNFETGTSWCFDNAASNCMKYGRLYNWVTAMEACPGGWHLPSKEEWGDLLDAAVGYERAGELLKSKTDWEKYKGKNGNGRDYFGFSAMPGGEYWRHTGGGFYGIGEFGFWWTATKKDDGGAYYWQMYHHEDYVLPYTSYYLEDDGLSVRCVRN